MPDFQWRIFGRQYDFKQPISNLKSQTSTARIHESVALRVASNSYCTFRVGTMYLGVEVHRVQEVIRAQRMTRIPGAPDVVRGLMNLRGQIVTALDMRRRLCMAESETKEPQMNVVVRTPDGPVSLLVNEIGDVIVVDQEQFEAPPETLQGFHRELITGSYKLQGRLMLVLNLDAAVRLAA